MATSASASASSRGIISPSERQFLIEGIRHNVRRDGRGRLDFRFIDIECGVFPQANGSARLKLEQAGTDVIACVKVRILPNCFSQNRFRDVIVVCLPRPK